MYRCAVDMLSFLGVKGFFKQAFKARLFYFKKQTTPQKSHNSNRNLEWKVEWRHTFISTYTWR